MTSDRFADFNPQQRAAARFEGHHCLVLAGAGTGKTTTIVGRVTHLIETDVDASRILLLTFTRRAATEMRQRLTRTIGAAAKKVSAGTFHHFCLAHMRRWPDLFECRDTTVIDRDDQLQLMKLARAEVVGRDASFPKAAALVNYQSYARNTNQALAKYLTKFTDLDEPTVATAGKVVDHYNQRKASCRYLDYDDILHVFAKRLHARPQVRQKLAARFDHLLVDEMQDTNPLQWLILDGLRDPAKLFCVGDDAQSIYAFRGADFKNVHSFTERLPDASVLKLHENYRSTQEILDLSNWLLERSSVDYAKRLTAARGPGHKPQLIDLDGDFDEADWIAEDLLQRHEDGNAWRDHMILTRTAHGSRSVEAALIENKIPYRFIGGTTLLRSAHVKDLLALLRAVDNGADELAWMRYLTMWPRIGEKTAARTINRLTAAPDPAAIVEILKRSHADKPAMADAISKIAAVGSRPAEAIGVAAKVLEPVLEKRYDRWDQRRKDFELLRRLASSHRSVGAFIETYTLDPVTESEVNHDDTDDIVTLITVHSAKGTEAPVCYIIGLQPGNYPHVRSVGKEDEEEEDRRVLYVAMTRAQNELIMTRTLRSGGAFVPHWHRGRAAAGSSGGTYLLEKLPDDLVQSDFVMEEDDGEEIVSFRGR